MRILAVLLFCLGLLCLAQAQIPQTGAGKGSPGGAPFTPSCSQSTAFLARATALTNNTDKGHYDALICGLETDGVGCSNTLDFLYVLAAPDSATELLNLCSSSYTLVVHGSIPLTPNVGVIGDGSTGYLDTQFNYGLGGTFAGTCLPISFECYFGVYITSGRTASANTMAIGTTDGSTFWSYIRPYVSGSTDFDVVGKSFVGSAGTSAKGQWVATRPSANNVALYQNSSTTAFVSSTTDAAGGPPTGNFYISAYNNAGTPTGFSTDTISFAFMGGGGSFTTAANMKKIADRINTFATALGINAY